MSNNIQTTQLESIEKKLNISALSLAMLSAITGIVLFVLSAKMEHSMLSSTMIFFGLIIIGFSIFLFFARAKKDTYTKTNSPVIKKSIFFETNDFINIKNALENREFQAIKNSKRIDEGNVQMYALFSKDKKFAAVQLLKYEPFDFIPHTDIIIMENDMAEQFINKL